MPRMYERDGLLHKSCVDCKKIFVGKDEITKMFAGHSNCVDGLQSICQRCLIIVRWKCKGIRFHINPDEIWKKQKGICPVCNELISDAEDWFRSGAQLDHKHEKSGFKESPGWAREFVHNRCNQQIGWVENGRGLSRVLDYLRKHNDEPVRRL